MVKLNLKHLLYYLAFFPVLITQFIDTVNIDSPAVSRYASILSILVLFTLFIINKKYSIIRILIISFMFILLLFVIYFSRREIFLLNMFMLIFMANQIEFEDLLKKYFTVLLTLIVTVIFLNQIGIIDDIYNYKREFGIIRETLGFKFPTYLPNMFFHLTLIYYYIKKTFGYLDFISISVINIYLYQSTDTKAVYYYVFLFLFLVFILQKIKLKLSLKISSFIFSIVSISSVCVPVVLSMLYGTKKSFVLVLDKILTSRLYFGFQGIQKYGLNLFGANIQWVTLDKPKLLGLPYFYVDSSFLNIWLNYGLIVLLFLVVGFYFGVVKLLRNIDYSENYKYLLIFTILMLHSMFDPQFFTLLYNPFLLLIGYDFEISKNKMFTPVLRESENKL